MSLEALLAQLEARSVTPVTPENPGGVTARTAPVLACTPVTPVTPKKDMGALVEPPPPTLAPPCETGAFDCDLAGQERYCREHCRPSYSKPRFRVLPGGRLDSQGDDLPEEIRGWTRKARAGYREAVRSYTAAKIDLETARHLALVEGRSALDAQRVGSLGAVADGDDLDLGGEDRGA